MKLLVCSAMNDNEDRHRAQVWHNLQLKFLNETTEDFDYALWLSRVDRKDYERSAIIIGENHEERPKGPDFKLGYEKMIEFCRNSPGYDGYLILDSDAFPIRKGWQPLLLEKMGDKGYATPVRFELLDTFPSTSAQYIKPEFINDDYDPTPANDYYNMAGTHVIEHGTAMPRESHFPLIRTNRYNRHFLLGAIYFDMFFHHGGGSRKPVTRTCAYHDHIYDPSDIWEIEQKMFDDLQRDPWNYISELQHGKVCRAPSILMA